MYVYELKNQIFSQPVAFYFRRRFLRYSTPHREMKGKSLRVKSFNSIEVNVKKDNGKSNFALQNISLYSSLQVFRCVGARERDREKRCLSGPRLKRMKFENIQKEPCAVFA